jgi:replicative DNA helicase
LQILAPYDNKSTDKQNTDKAVLELKRISRDSETPVIAISSLNRQSYKDEISMEAFKESGAIEYSSDVLIGLQLKGVGDNNFNVDIAKGKTPREVELKVLKNRNGKTGDSIDYNYHSRINLFKEAQNKT